MTKMLTTFALALAVFAGLFGALWWVLRLESGGARGMASAVHAAEIRRAADDLGVDRAQRGRVERLESTVAALQDEVDRLIVELEVLRASRAEASVPVVSAEAPEAEATPRWYLQQYIDSFEDGGRGSEYFRLAVAAYTPTLLPDIAAELQKPDGHPELRVHLVELLADGRLAGNVRAIDTLLELLARRSDVSTAALAALSEIGTPGTALALEQLVWRLEGAGLRAETLRVLARLAGPAANASLVRLFASAPDDASRALLVTLLNTLDPGAALGVFEQAALSEKVVRLQAASAIGEFRDPAIVAFLETWRAIERDDEVRRALGRARERVERVPNWSALQAVGPPDAEPASSDHPKAWASRTGDMGAQWLELTYEPPLRAHAARIFEVNVPGAVTELVGYDVTGRATRLWRGNDPTREAGVFEVSFAQTSFPVQRLRVKLDTNRRSGWNEIDAVELVGPAGRAWASDARASSSFGN